MCFRYPQFASSGFLEGGSDKQPHAEKILEKWKLLLEALVSFSFKHTYEYELGLSQDLVKVQNNLDRSIGSIMQVIIF